MKVININNTSDHTCRCDSWLAHWENYSKSPLNRSCYVLGCTNKPEVGAHVKKYHSSNQSGYFMSSLGLGASVQKHHLLDQKWYIIPLCQGHNKKINSPLELVNDSKLVLAKQYKCSY